MLMKLKNLMVTKIENSNCDKTQKLKLWQKSKTQFFTKLKKSICDKTQIVRKVLTKFKLLQNSNCDKNQHVTKLKIWQNSNCEGKTKKNHCNKTQTVTKLKKSIFLQNSTTKIVTKLKKNRIVTILEIWQNSIYEEKTFEVSFSKNILKP